MFFLKSKKGIANEKILASIQDIGLAAFAIILLFNVVQGASTGEFIEEKKVVISTGLLIDTLTSTNGNTFIYADISNNTISITDKLIKVGDRWTQRFHLLKDKNTKIFSDLSFENTSTITLLKAGSNLYIGKELIPINYHSCPFVFFKKPTNVAILPSTEFRLETALKQALNSEITLTMADTATAKLIGNPELIIMLNSKQEDFFKIEIPVNSPKSRRLACIITNELQRENSGLKTEIQVIEHPLFQQSDSAVIITLTTDLNNDINTFKSLSNAFKSTFT